MIGVYHLISTWKMSDHFSCFLFIIYLFRFLHLLVSCPLIMARVLRTMLQVRSACSSALKLTVQQECG